MMPPKHIEPAELFSALTTMPRPSRVVDYPRQDADGKPIGQMIVRMLTQTESTRTKIAAGDSVRRTAIAAAPIGNTNKPAGKDWSTDQQLAFADYLVTEELHLALRDVNDIERPLFPSPAKMQEHIPSAEILALYEVYRDVCDELGPVYSVMSQAEADAWIDRLTEGGLANPVPFFGLANTRILALTSVSRLQKSRTEHSSVGEPPDSTESSRTVPTNDEPQPPAPGLS